MSKVTCFLLVIGKDYQTAFHKMYNVIHCLLVMWKEVFMLPFTKCATYCLLVIGKDVTPFYKMCNVTYLLLVIGSDMIRLPFTKCAVSLTPC